MRGRHGSNLTRRDFAILNARLDKLEGVGRHRRPHRHGRGHGGRPYSITTTTTTHVDPR